MNLLLFTQDELTAGTPASGGILASKGILARRDGRAVHLLKVLHKKAGDRFDAGLAGGRLGTGLIEAIGPEGIVFSLTLDREPPPRTPLRLGVGFPRPIQLRRLLRDCASLGLEAVDLMGTELGEKSYRDTNLIQDGGAEAALIEGAVQGRDTRLPHLGVYPALADWLKARPWTHSLPPGTADTVSAEAAEAAANSPKGAPLLLAADNVRPAGSFSALESAGASPAVLAIGAERGWSGREREMLEKAGFTRLSLGSRALRTETACTAAAVLVMSKMGLLG